ncbi:hypothetical protein EL18_01348 [Nitratireductor basaltis]|uniref:Uncharacterized protein n=1 Tax=Nitratireductor basaltis TaxID=472175 RepID=A0A084UBI1_9HYPH|nr:hypothetical protein EL18_01348 [Nitratireductor basaltis]
MSNRLGDDGARYMALALYPGRKWNELTDGEREEARKAAEELRRVMGDHSAKSPTGLH